MGALETPSIDYTQHIKSVTTTHNWQQGGVVSHTIMNRDFLEDHPKEIDLNALRELFKRGIPTSWANIHPRIFVDDVDNPTLLAKIRRNDNVEELLEHPDQSIGWLDFRHEFQVAFEAAEILSSPNVQSKVKAEGFNMLIPVMPILGTDVVDTKERIIIYPYVSGIRMDNEKDPKRVQYVQKVRNIVKTIESALDRKNINAIDLSLLQFIINPETNTIYLIDMEGYFKKKP